MADVDYDRLRDELAKAITAGLAQTTRDNRDYQKKESEERRIAGLLKQMDMLKVGLKNSTQKFNDWSDLFTKGKMQYNDVQKSLEALDYEIQNTTDATKKRDLEEKRRETQRAATWDNTKKATLNMVAVFTTSAYGFAKDLLGATKDVVSALTQTGSDTKMFTSIFGAMSKVVTAGATGIGNVFSGLGGVVGGLVQIKFPLLGRMITSITGILGSAFGALAQVAGTVVTGALNILAESVESYIKSFNRMNTAGAAFAGGMGEMIRTANNAGLTIEQFSNVLSKNAEAIANSGLGMTDGARKLSKAMSTGGAELQRQLFNLGYNVEEQGGLFAETMKMMTSTAGPLKATDREVAEQTKKYAENLRFLSAITGEDGKKRMAETRKNLDNLLMQRKLQEMGGTQLATFQNALSRVPPELQRMLIQQSEYGTIFSQDLAIMKNQSPALQNFIAELTDAFKTGTLDQEQVNAALQKYAPGMKKELPQSLALAIAAYKDNSSVAGQAANAMSNVLKVLQPIPENINEVQQNLEKAAQADKADPITNLMTTIQEQAQSLRVLVESEIAGLLTKFGNALADNVTTIADGIKRLAEAFASLDLNTILSTLKDTLGALIPGFSGLSKILGDINAKEAGKVTGEVTGAGVGGYLGYKAGGYLGKKAGEAIFGKSSQTGLPGANLGKPDGTAQNPYHVVVLGNVGGAVPGGIAGGPAGPGQPKPGTPPPGSPQPGKPKGGGGAKYGKLAGSLIGKVGGLLGGGVIGSMVVGKLGEIAGEKLGEMIESVYNSVMGEDGAIEGRAMGGLVKGSNPYIVGEMGPELFVPATTGSIVPNNVVDALGALYSAQSSSSGSVTTEMQNLVAELRKSSTPSSQALQPELKNILEEQSNLYHMTLQTQQEMVDIMSDMRGIQQQILNISG